MNYEPLTVMKRIAILIPCYNEETTISKVVNDFKGALPGAEIHVYDNNSTDGTAEAALRSGAAVRREYRQGKGNVIRSMFREIWADCYIMVDGDDTYPAGMACEMARLVLEGKADMVTGDRLSTDYYTVNSRPLHNTGNRIVKGLINRLFSTDLRDIMTGFRAFSPAFVKTFPVLSKGFEIETEMTLHALDKNFLIREIPVAYRERPSGSVSKLNTVRDGYRVIRTIFTLFRDYRPFPFFGLISLFLALFSLALFIPVLSEYLRSGLVPRFPTLIVSGVMMLASLQSFFTGAVLSVIVKKHRQLFELELNRATLDVMRKIL
jgi:glycosyltransferase involved in cell wall biosynthesis